MFGTRTSEGSDAVTQTACGRSTRAIRRATIAFSFRSFSLWSSRSPRCASTAGSALLPAPDPEPVPQPPPAEGKAGSIEIALPNGTRISVDASVNEKALSRVLRAMKELT